MVHRSSKNVIPTKKFAQLNMSYWYVLFLTQFWFSLFQCVVKQCDILLTHSVLSRNWLFVTTII